jgi:hypothetical protein
LTAITNTIGTRHDDETVRLNNIGKEKALFELGESISLRWHDERRRGPWWS